MSFAAKLVRHRRRVADIGQNELRAEAGADRGCARADPARAAGNENASCLRARTDARLLVAIDIFSPLRCRLVDHAQSMIRKSGDRFSEKIMLKQKARAGCRSDITHPALVAYAAFAEQARAEQLFVGRDHIVRDGVRRAFGIGVAPAQISAAPMRMCTSLQFSCFPRRLAVRASACAPPRAALPVPLSGVAQACQGRVAGPSSVLLAAVCGASLGGPCRAARAAASYVLLGRVAAFRRGTAAGARCPADPDGGSVRARHRWLAGGAALLVRASSFSDAIDVE